jgi:hypothetical protein
MKARMFVNVAFFVAADTADGSNVGARVAGGVRTGAGCCAGVTCCGATATGLGLCGWGVTHEKSQTHRSVEHARTICRLAEIMALFYSEQTKMSKRVT